MFFNYQCCYLFLDRLCYILWHNVKFNFSIIQAIEYSGDRSFEAIVKFIEDDGKVVAPPTASVSTVLNYLYIFV